MARSAPSTRRQFVSLWALALASSLAFAEYPRVEIAGVERAPMLQEISLNGTVIALQRSEVSVSVAGLVAERKAETGDRVERGALLLTLDDELARLEHERSKAETREAENRLREARRVLEEARSVRGGRAIPATEVSRRESEAGIAEAALARVRATEQLQAARLRRHAVHAPIGGVVSARAVETGQWVEPGTAVFTLVDTDDLLIDFQVPQEALARLDDTAQLLLQTPAGPRQAGIASWLPVADDRARTFLLRARPPQESGLVPGMAVAATLQLTREQEALSVSRDAINRYPDGRVTVWVARPADDSKVFTVSEQRIRVIGSAGGRIYVSEGLDGTEQVVTRGNEALRSGLEVTLAED